MPIMVPKMQNCSWPRRHHAAVVASRQVVQANPVAGLERRHRGSGSFDNSGYFVAERERQRVHSRCAGPVMGVGVAYPRRLDAHQHVPRANLRHRNGLVLERASRFDQSHRFHHRPLIVRSLPPVGKYKPAWHHPTPALITPANIRHLISDSIAHRYSVGLKSTSSKWSTQDQVNPRQCQAPLSFFAASWPWPGARWPHFWRINNPSSKCPTHRAIVFASTPFIAHQEMK